MHARAAADDFLDKWRARWPEWRVAQVFLPVSQRAVASAWFALLAEFAEAAWGGTDPTPGLAKLGWWQEELRGWAKGARRHPLGDVLQACPADWTELSDAMPALKASRTMETGGSEGMLSRLRPFADAVADAEAVLFDGDAPCAEGVACALFAEHTLHTDPAAASGSARALFPHWPIGRAPRPRRIHDALLRARLRRMADGGADAPLPAWDALFRAWRAARGRVPRA